MTNAAIAIARDPVIGPLIATASTPATAFTANTKTSGRNRSSIMAISNQTKYAASGIHSGAATETTNEAAMIESMIRATCGWLLGVPLRHAATSLCG